MGRRRCQCLARCYYRHRRPARCDYCCPVRRLRSAGRLCPARRLFPALGRRRARRIPLHRRLRLAHRRRPVRRLRLYLCLRLVLRRRRPARRRVQTLRLVKKMDLGQKAKVFGTRFVRHDILVRTQGSRHNSRDLERLEDEDVLGITRKYL